MLYCPRSDPKPPAKSLSEYREIYGDNFGTVVYLLFVLYGPGSLFKACPDAEKAVDIEFLSVSKKYRKRGIGGNLTKLALEVREGMLLMLVNYVCNNGRVVCTVNSRCST